MDQPHARASCCLRAPGRRAAAQRHAPIATASPRVAGQQRHVRHTAADTPGGRRDYARQRGAARRGRPHPAAASRRYGVLAAAGGAASLRAPVRSYWPAPSNLRRRQPCAPPLAPSLATLLAPPRVARLPGALHRAAGSRFTRRARPLLAAVSAQRASRTDTGAKCALGRLSPAAALIRGALPRSAGTTRTAATAALLSASSAAGGWAKAGMGAATLGAAALLVRCVALLCCRIQGHPRSLSPACIPTCYALPPGGADDAARGVLCDADAREARHRG